MNATTAVSEKRQTPRVPVQGHMRYRRIPIDGRGPCNALLQDVGEGGFRFRSDELLNRRSDLLLELHLPGSYLVRSLATVAWVKAMPGDDGYEVGGMFVEPSHEARSALAHVVLDH